MLACSYRLAAGYDVEGVARGVEFQFTADFFYRLSMQGFDRRFVAFDPTTNTAHTDRGNLALVVSPFVARLHLKEQASVETEEDGGTDN
ncbi:MAG TPA: hypothetical protein DIC52_05925 [Candidatus Latescibacteria bacterium]|nr:hypothetical protein [Candidatus Latescibacterota bacterium]